MRQSSRRILWISTGDPWSDWTLSGVSLGVCRELGRRGLLYGAIGTNAWTSRELHGRSPRLRIGHKLTDRWRRIVGAPPWDDESQGIVGRVLRDCPEGTKVIYALATPNVNHALQIERFRWMDLSVRDAVDTESFGHAGMNEDQILAKVKDQNRFLNACKGVVALSTTAANAISEDQQYPRELITPIGAGPAVDVGVEPDFNLRRYERARVLFVGRDWKRKRGDMLVDAMQIVRRTVKHATLQVLGPAECPNSAEGIEFLPALNKGNARDLARLNQIFLEASLFSMPSIIEPWGLVYVEAMRAGVPIVGFHRWGLPDIVEDGVSGRLSHDESVHGLAEAITEVLSDPLRLQEMGRAARVRVSDVLDWPNVVDRLLYRVMPEVLGDREPVWMQPAERAIQDKLNPGVL